MVDTVENLKAAFAGESQANRKYLFFSEKADASGNKQLARLFRAAATAETVHAQNHLKVLGEIKSDKENLQAAINGENYEFTEMYPGFIKQAESESNPAAVKTFNHANQVEQIHHKLFQSALKDVEAGKKLKETVYYVCPVCGNTVEGSAPDKCPICWTPGDRFMKIT
ncbi:MAG TPA: rubrerythrin family protein [Dehalococcoidales bacterium]|nr:rubrerythrin family protein [Dehalococcoidales bacterium]